MAEVYEEKKYSFPCISNDGDGLNSVNNIDPTINIANAHEEGIPSDVLYFTVPMESLKTSPSSFMDVIKDNIRSTNYRHMLCVLFYLISKQFYVTENCNNWITDFDERRIRIYMEYLLHKDSDPDDFILIDCVGIRFHIYIYDANVSFPNALVSLIKENGGEIKSVEDESTVEGPPSKKRKTAPGGSKKEKKIYPHNVYTQVKSPNDWMDLVHGISKNSEVTFNTMYSNTKENMLPDITHPYYYSNLFSWKNSFVADMKEEYKTHSGRNDGHAFPFPSSVFYIDSYLCHPAGILCVKLPRSAEWEVSYDLHRVTTSLNDKRVTEAAVINFDNLKIVNELRDVHDMLKQRRERILVKYEDDELSQKLKDFKDRSVGYLANTWDVSADISVPMKAMVSYSTEVGTWHYNRYDLVDHKLSSFGNFVASIMLELQNIYKIEAHHSILLRVLVNAVDAYRYEMNLHNNVLLAGAGASGKSHMFNIMAKDLFLKDTTKKLDHMTDKSVTSHGDKNDMIYVFHEAPPILMGQTNVNSGQETGSSLIKGIMTESESNTESLTVTDDGRRVEVNCKSERVGTMMMATNERCDRIPEALATRMIILPVNQVTVERTNKRKVNSTAHNGILSYDTKVQKIECKKRWHNRQILTNIVNKMIYLGILEEVDISVFDAVSEAIIEYMENRNYIERDSVNIRSLGFLKVFARTLTILHAVDKFIIDPKSPGYDPEGKIKFNSKKAFETLKHIQPYLFCTEEIALFTFSINIDQIIDVYQYNTMEVILATLDSKFVRSGLDREVSNGRWFTKPVFNNLTSIYNLMSSTQKSAGFMMRLSDENLQVAFRNLTKRSCNNDTVLIYDSNLQSVSVNVDFVKENFSWDDNLGRFKCDFDIQSIVLQAYKSAYVTKYSKYREKVITGFLHGVNDWRYLFNTCEIKPNNRSYSVSLGITNSYGMKFPEVEQDNAFERTKVKVVYNADFQEFRYKSFLKQCNLDENISIEDTLYNMHLGDETAFDYPTGLRTCTFD